MGFFKILALLKLGFTTLALWFCIDLLTTGGLYLTGFLALFAGIVYFNLQVFKKKKDIFFRR